MSSEPGRLFNRKLVGHCVEYPTGTENPEMPQSHCDVRSGEDVEETQQNERWDVLKIIQMVPENQAESNVNKHIP